MDQSISSDHHTLLKRHSCSSLDWSVPPTSELSPTSLTSSSPDLSQNTGIPDDSFIELDSKHNRISSSLKKHYRYSFSLSCPALVYSIGETQQIVKSTKSKSLSRLSKSSNKTLVLINDKKPRSLSPNIKNSSKVLLKKRCREKQVYGKKPKLENINADENNLIAQQILNEIVE